LDLPTLLEYTQLIGFAGISVGSDVKKLLATSEYASTKEI